MSAIVITNLIIVASLIAAGLIIIKMGVKVVSQSDVYVVERFGKLA